MFREGRAGGLIAVDACLGDGVYSASSLRVGCIFLFLCDIFTFTTIGVNCTHKVNHFFFFFFCGSLVLVRVIVAVVAVVAVLYNRLFVALFVALSHRLVLLLLFMLMVMLYRCSRHLVCRLHVFLPSLSSVLLLLCGSQDSGRRNS